MSAEFSPVITPAQRGKRGAFLVKSLDLQSLGQRASPLVVLDDFRVTGQPFGPHPHAGFSAVTYVFEDSPSALRSRDSLGNDLIMSPGGIVWTQAGRGIIHEELPATPDRELHGLQFFVNLSSKNKHTPPLVLGLEASEVPEWHGEDGDRVRVVVGSYESVASPLAPAEPFQLIDVELRREIHFALPEAHNALIYVLVGEVMVRTEQSDRRLTEQQAIAVHGIRASRLRIAAPRRARILILSGPEIREPVVSEGPFIMNEQSEIDAALSRYRSGQLGHLAPASTLGGSR